MATSHTNTNGDSGDLASKGQQDSECVMGSPKVLGNQLRSILARNKKEAKDHAQKQTQIIAALEGEVAAIETHINDLEHQIPRQREEILEANEAIEAIASTKDKEIEELTKQIDDK